mgnify:CR=1 FL=1
MSSSYPNKRRPYGPPAIWATDATMTAPSMPYDGAATKTRPSDGLTAAAPEELERLLGGVRRDANARRESSVSSRMMNGERWATASGMAAPPPPM